MNNNTYTYKHTCTDRQRVDYLMIVRVVISRATLVPCFSWALSICFLQPTTYRGPLLAFTITAQHNTSVTHICTYVYTYAYTN